MKLAAAGVLVLIAIVSFATTAQAEDLKSELHWQAATSGTIAPEHDAAPLAPTLDEIRTRPYVAPPQKADAAGARAELAVAAVESFPLAYRPILRRYFDAIRSEK